MLKPCATAVAALAATVVIATEPLPPPVAEARRYSIENCRPGKATFEAHYVQTADFNGDGKPDYVVDEGGVNCVGSDISMCGSGGCSIVAYVSTPKGYPSRGLPSWLGFGVSIESGSAAPPILVITGRDGTARYRWDGKEFRRLAK